jgi:uncharacterized protein YeeX (DUF496 family)
MNISDLCKKIAEKSSLLDNIVNNTKDSFTLFRETAQEIIKQMQEEFDKQIGDCVVNIIMRDE